MRAQLFGRRLVAVAIGAPDDHRRPVRGKAIGHAKADAVIAAGDERDLSGQIESGEGRPRVTAAAQR
jgi:hypothetical protein